jgi:S-adenosylmethionine:tRNA ribosyltransferase-isomerase
MTPIHPQAFVIDPVTLDFQLPDELIAQEPLHERDQARLMVVHKRDGDIEHKRFADIATYLRRGDVVVVNKAKVDHAKLIGRKRTGGKVEIIFIEKTGRPNEWRALVRSLVKDGTEVVLDGGLVATVVGRNPDGDYCVRVESPAIDALLHEQGQLPLPPYIKRAESDERREDDQAYYQTVYAAVPGSIAAPTAGLHFTEALLAELKAKGVEIIEIVLHVGWGTFRPIASAVSDHKMLAERYEVSEAAAARIRLAKQECRRVIAVGTTCTRTLETIANPSAPLQGESALFIQPGFKFRVLDGLVTNFHVPKSTPVALTAAFAGLHQLEIAYASAIYEQYRFYSYGDAMLIL